MITSTAFDTIPLPKERQEWLEARRLGIGGSDAAAVCGLSNWKTALGLYMEKIGEGEDQDETERMYWGKRLEDIVAEEYTRRTERDASVWPVMLRSIRHPFMLANLDRLILPRDPAEGYGVLECKTVDRYAAKEWGDPGTSNVPKEYMLQVQHYMVVTGFTWADLAVLIGGNEFRIYRIDHDPEIAKSLVTLEEEFWGMVKNRIPPEPDCDHKTTRELLQRLYPKTNGEIVDLSDLAADSEHLREAKGKIKELEGIERFHSNRLLAAMGEASLGLLPDGTAYARTWREPYTRAASEVAGGFTLRFQKNPKLPK